jgi:hypothetical protein
MSNVQAIVEKLPRMIARERDRGQQVLYIDHHEADTLIRIKEMMEYGEMPSYGKLGHVFPCDGQFSLGICFDKNLFQG